MNAPLHLQRNLLQSITNIYDKGNQAMKLEDFVKTGNGNNWILDRAIYACIHGSRAYGTNTPESDTDVKGVTIPPKHYFYGFVDKFEQYEQNEPDLVIYDIRKFFKLASDCNPNIIEVLFVEDEDIIHQTKIGEKIRQHRHEFLSQRAEYTFCGYAVSQLKRLRSHRGWLMNPPKKKPERSEYGLPEHKKISQHELDKLINQGYDFPTEVSRMLQKEKEYQSALNYYKQYQQWLKNRNSERWQMEKDFGFDGKHATNLVRLLRLSEEILRHGEVFVKRPDAEELKSIKNGAWSYDYLINWAEEQKEKVRELKETTHLPKKPNRNKLDELCVELVEEMIYE